MKQFFERLPMLEIFLFIFFLGLAFILVDVFCTETHEFSGVVLDKHYKAEKTAIGTGIVSTPQGIGAVTTVSIDPENFLVMVKAEDGSIYTAECSPEIFYSKERGSRIVCKKNKGVFTGLVWSIEGVK